MKTPSLVTLSLSLCLTGCFEYEKPVDIEPNLNDQITDQVNSNNDNSNNDNSNTDNSNTDNSNTDNSNTNNQVDLGNDSDLTDSQTLISRITSPASDYLIQQNNIQLTFLNKGKMWLYLGTEKGKKDILDSSVTGTSFSVNNLPTNLTTLYAKMWTYSNDQWESTETQWSVQLIDDNNQENNFTQAGQKIWEQTCSNSACHSAGAINGVFSEGSLSTKGLYSTQDLSSYIAQYMPLTNPESCDSDCADDVAKYISSWHALPENDSESTNSTGEPRNPIEIEQCSTDTSVGYQAIRLLTRDQYQKSVEDLIGLNYDIKSQLPVDLKSGAFTNNNHLNVLDSAYISYMSAAKDIAQWSAERNFSDFLQCSSFNQTCASTFIDSVAWKIIRRPFTSNERNTYLALAKGESSEGDVKEGIELALTALLSSPQFLYRHEIGEPASGLGNGVYQLTQYELASFISYSFSGTTPDDTLLNAAKNNQLSTPSQIENQISRLLDTAEAKSILEELVHSWLKTDLILTQQKDSNLFGDFNSIAPHMMNELSETFSHIMLNENEKYESLYNPNYAFLNQALSQHYKVGNVSGNSLQKTYNNERGGLLLSGAFLSRWAHPDETNAITRAAHIRRDMLCQDIPNPPAGVSTSLKDKEGELGDFLSASTTTQRMRYHSTTEFGSCGSCHVEIINPLGFGLEDYNAVGVKRHTDQNGNNIDASGAVWSPFLQLQFYDDPNRIKHMTEFNGGKELADLLATDPEISGLAKSCFAKQMLSHVTGLDSRALSDSDREDVTPLSALEKNAYTCDVMDLVDTLTNESPRRMLEKMGALESIRYRKAWSR